MKKFVFLGVLSICMISCKQEKKQESTIPEKESTESTFTKELSEKAGNFFQSISTLDRGTYSEDQITLGHKLFFDKRLSKNGNISCNSCHALTNYGVDNLATSPGDDQIFGERNSPSVIYAALQSSQFWDGRAKDVEEQAGMPILNPIEHGIESQQFLINRLKKIDEYQQLFKKAYKGEKEPMTYENLTKAIGAFERQLIPESRFDQFLDGNTTVLTEQEKIGMNKFIDNGCIACHNGVAVGGRVLQKFGLYGDYWELTKSEKVDLGLYEQTKEEKDKLLFKVPGLRNVEKTYPYFHDGSVDSLKDAIRIMGKLQRNVDLSDEDVNDIEAFLKTLTADINQQYKTSPTIKVQSN